MMTSVARPSWLTSSRSRAIRHGAVLGAAITLTVAYTMAFLSARPGDIGRDLVVCQDAVRAWLGGAPMYPAFELAGPYDLSAFGLILYPPITTALFAPTLLLPLPFWWLIPGGIIGATIWRLHPRGRWLCAIAICVLYPNSINLVVAGNPSIWLAAALALAIYWRPAAAFVLLKPSLFPFALVGVRSRGWWALVGVFAVASLVLLPQAFDWLAVVRNGRAGVRPAGLLYSYQDWCLLTVPLLAWAGSARRPQVRLRQSIEEALHARGWARRGRGATAATASPIDADASGATPGRSSTLDDLT
jgi:hypothetical protein